MPRASHAAAAPPGVAPSYVPTPSRANMLVPQAYEVSWTDLIQNFNETLAFADVGTTGSTAAEGIAGSLASNASGAVLPANPQRACLIVQNNSATGGPVLWFNFGQPAVASSGGSFALQPGASLVIAQPQACPKEALYIAWSGSGTALGAYYQNSLPQAVLSTSQVQGWQDNLGAEAWGYSTPPAAAAPAASSTYRGLLPSSTPAGAGLGCW